MQSLGIFRRIDDLGRIAIPKDMRALLGLKVGDAMEIICDKDKKEIFLKAIK